MEHKIEADAGYEKYRGPDTGCKYLGGIGMRSFR